VPSVETRLVIEEFENQKRGWCCTVSLAEGFVRPNGGNAELRGEVALLKRPRHGGK
jgi:hypothetical protein